MKTKARTAGSSQPERLIVRSESDIRRYTKSKKAKEDAALSRSRGSEPSAADLEDIPLLTEGELAAMYRPLKSPITVRVDADILAWLKSKGGHYQRHLNQTLREAMLRERKVRRP